jgi:hypothetical protein
MVKRKSSSAQSRADGPSSLSELLRFPEQFGKILAHPDCSANWDRLCENGFIVTSGYSGTGAFELASDMVLCSARDAAGETRMVPTCVFYSASDSAEACRKALLMHPPKTRPRHIFGDMLDRVPARTLEELRNLEAKYLGLWSNAKAEFALGGITKQNLNQDCDELGEDYVRQVLEILAQTEFLQEVHCYVHNKPCRLSPRLACGAQCDVQALWL